MSIRFETFSVIDNKTSNRRRYDNAACFAPIAGYASYDIVKYPAETSLISAKVIWWSELMNSWGLTNHLVFEGVKNKPVFYVAKQATWGLTLTILTCARYVHEFSQRVNSMYEVRERTPEQLFFYLQALHAKGGGNSNHALVNGYSLIAGGTRLITLPEYIDKIGKCKNGSGIQSFSSVFGGFSPPTGGRLSTEQKLAIKNMKSYSDLEAAFPDLKAYNTTK